MRGRDARIYEELESARKGHLVRYETGSRSPASPYLVREVNPRGVAVRNAGELDWADRVLYLLGRRGGEYVVAYQKRWPGPELEAWLYRVAGMDDLGDRTSLTGFEVTDLEFDPHEWFDDVHMADAWPHV